MLKIAHNPKVEGSNPSPATKKGVKINLSLLLCFILAFTISCKENPVEEYTDTLIDARKKAEKVAKSANISQLSQSINEFYIANDRYPEDLKEIEEFSGLTLDYGKYNYDSKTGVLTEKH